MLNSTYVCILKVHIFYLCLMYARALVCVIHTVYSCCNFFFAHTRWEYICDIVIHKNYKAIASVTATVGFVVYYYLFYFRDSNRYFVKSTRTWTMIFRDHFNLYIYTHRSHKAGSTYTQCDLRGKMITFSFKLLEGNDTLARTNNTVNCVISFFTRNYMTIKFVILDTSYSLFDSIIYFF